MKPLKTQACFYKTVINGEVYEDLQNVPASNLSVRFSATEWLLQCQMISWKKKQGFVKIQWKLNLYHGKWEIHIYNFAIISKIQVKFRQTRSRYQNERVPPSTELGMLRLKSCVLSVIFPTSLFMSVCLLWAPDLQTEVRIAFFQLQVNLWPKRG